MAQNYYQKDIETMPAEEMRKLQSEKLVKQVLKPENKKPKEEVKDDTPKEKKPIWERRLPSMWGVLPMTFILSGEAGTYSVRVLQMRI